MSHKSYNFRIYPNASQQELLGRHFGHNRFVWNHFLRTKIDFYSKNKELDKKGLNYYDTAKLLVELKKQPEFEWLNEINSQSMQQTLRHLDTAYQGVFKKKSKFPRFKKKTDKNSFTVPQHISIEDGMLYIPKFKTGIKINVHREIIGNICYVTISRTARGNYYCALTVEFQPIELPKTGSSIGIDLGIKDFATLSDGTKYANPRHFVASQKRLAFQQRNLSSSKKDSNSYRFRKRSVASLHARIANQRKDFLHKLSYEIVKNHDFICMESLNVKSMLKNRKLAKHIADVGWGCFATFVKYKTEWYGKTLVEIDQWFPSSQLCSNCGFRNSNLKLSDRTWVCPQCGCVHDRDVNAANNILKSGLGTNSDSKQKQLEPLPNARLRRKRVGKALKVEAQKSLVSG